MEVGVQVSSLRPLLNNPVEVDVAFARLEQIGCRTVQLQWIDRSVPSGFIAHALERHGLRSVSVQDTTEAVLTDLDYYVNLNGITGGKWLCISRIPEKQKSPEGVADLAWKLGTLAELLEKLGQRLCFHPVSTDFPWIETLLTAVPELDLCPDLYHLDKVCDDLPGFLRKWSGRIPLVHFKDYRDGVMVPAGQGQVRWDGVRETCRDLGILYAFAEQESWQDDPYFLLREAMDWIGTE